jgi:hypothetical protein
MNRQHNETGTALVSGPRFVVMGLNAACLPYESLRRYCGKNWGSAGHCMTRR